MATLAAARAPRSAGRPSRPRQRLSEERRPPQVAEPTPVGISQLAASWRGALDAAESALRAGRESLPPAEVSSRSQLLVAERAATLRLLRLLALERESSARFVHLLPRRELRGLLELPAHVTACVFELDGVLVASAELHAAAWQQTFDELLSDRRNAIRGEIAPFHTATDYARHMHGKPRLQGVIDFLESRGVGLPLGAETDPPGSATVHGLARRKNDVLVHLIEARGVHSFDDSRHYVETAVEAGLATAVVSASANTDRILERTGLADLIDARVDGHMMAAEHLRKRPAPDVLLSACRLLGVNPSAAAGYETTPAGVAAARAAAYGAVVAIDRSGHASALRDAGADIVTPELGALLERRIAA
jgi:beta-phosphoglucomutase-like phosphatase (HAD superfamily)